jgi:hypothetical protein
VEHLKDVPLESRLLTAIVRPGWRGLLEESHTCLLCQFITKKRSSIILTAVINVIKNDATVEMKLDCLSLASISVI